MVRPRFPHQPCLGRLANTSVSALVLTRAVNPITKTNWEGTGVDPDVKVAAYQALDVASKLAADRIRNSPAGKQQ